MIEVSFPDFDIDYITIDIAGTGQYFHCFNGLKRCDNYGSGTNNAGSIASHDCTTCRTGEDTAQAGGIMRQNGHRHSVRGDSTTIHPGNAMFKTGIIDKITSLHIVKTIHNHIRALNESLDV